MRQAKRARAFGRVPVGAEAIQLLIYLHEERPCLIEESQTLCRADWNVVRGATKRDELDTDWPRSGDLVSRFSAAGVQWRDANCADPSMTTDWESAPSCRRCIPGLHRGASMICFSSDRRISTPSRTRANFPSEGALSTHSSCGVKKLDSVGTAVPMIAAEPVQTEALC